MPIGDAAWGPGSTGSPPIDQKCVAGRNCLKVLDQSGHNSVYPQAYPPQLGIKTSASGVGRRDFTDLLGRAVGVLHSARPHIRTQRR